MKNNGIDSPAVAATIQFEDSQIAQRVALLKSVGIYDQTEIVIVNDHGNTAINTVIPDSGPGSIDQFLNDNGIPTAQTTTDRVALVWLQNAHQAQAAIKLLSTPHNKAQFGIQAITPASGLGAYLVAPTNRTPDFIVWPTDGSHGTLAVVYASGPKFGLFLTCDTGGEVKPSILGRLLHHVLKGRGASLFRCFSSEPIGQLHDIDRGGDGNMGQMRFGQAKVPRAT